MQTLKRCVGLIFFLFLSGCDRGAMTYEYLMEHPNVLQDKFVECNRAALPENSCDVVKKAESDFLQLVNDRSSAPENFGQQIRAIQTQLAQLKDQPAQQAQYQQLEQRLKILYAVIAVTSPE